MPPTERDNRDFRLEEWLVQPSLGRISGPSGEVHLEPRAMALLVHLAQHAGEVVSRREILDAVWQEEFVSDATVSGAIAKLRRALGDDARQPRFIETLAKRGYRLLARPVGIRDLIGSPAGCFSVGDWTVFPGLNRMSRGDVSIVLEPDTMDVLLCLAERAGETVPRQELVDRVWRTEAVPEPAVDRRVAELRAAIGELPGDIDPIEAVPDRGYRLAAAVGLVEPEPRIAPFPERRYGTGREPYPGLAAFTEADAAVFFGREIDVGAVWRRIASRRLLAVVGPSGVGKTSFLRAGVIASAPPGWRTLIATPGEDPFLSLARGLAPEIADKAHQIDQLLRFGEPDVALATLTGWRGAADDALLVIDQLEELFTLNPEETRVRFVALIERLATAGRIHVVLVLRDDFLCECQRHRPLAPIFRDLTMLGPLEPGDLRRALVEPARRRGFRFDDDELPDEIVTAAAGERGALPLLAFTARRLWELRDRDAGLVTRQAYESIGGVTGALARHAEQTLTAVGPDRLPLVRELFRNLVTAQGTRANRSTDDLLSVFPADRRREAGEVLRTLIDARLLTSYEDEATGDRRSSDPRRVEIVHESLLREWPRLVRWRTQDADAARLRDQLRQAARHWDQRGRPTELLWTGTPYREFLVWREHYPGGLSTTEAAFAKAMVEHAGRRRRRRRFAAAALLFAALVVAGITTALWRSSELQARRLEARQLIEDARQAMDLSPLHGFASALASLEVMDSREARRLALEALWRSPMPFVVDASGPFPRAFTGGEISPDGEWLVNGRFDGTLSLVPRSGGPAIEWQAHEAPVRGFFLPNSQAVMSITTIEEQLRIWTVPDHRPLGSQEQLATPGRGEIGAKQVNTLRNLGRWIRDDSAPGGWRYDRSAVPVWNVLASDATSSAALSEDGSKLIFARGDELLSVPVEDPTQLTPLVRAPSPVEFLAVHPEGDRLATAHADGTLRLWALGAAEARLLQSWPLGVDGPCNEVAFNPSGMLVAAGFDRGGTVARGLDDPPGSDPLTLLPGSSRLTELAFHPNGSWLVETRMGRTHLWPLERRHQPFVLRGHTSRIERVAFGPAARFLYSFATDGTVRLWPLSADAGIAPRVLHDWGHPVDVVVGWVAPSPDGRFVVTTGGEDAARLVPLDGSEPLILGGFEQRVLRAAVSPDGRSVAVPGRLGGRRVLRIWEPESGSVRDVDLGDPGPDTLAWAMFPEYLADGRLLVAINGPLYAVDRKTGDLTQVADGVGRFVVARKAPVVLSRRTVDSAPSAARVHDLAAGTSVELTSHGRSVSSLALDATGTIAVTGGSDGIIRVGPVSGSTPHLLVGPAGKVITVDVSSDGRWIASGHADGVIRLWRMPDLERPPIQDLPRDQLLARLRPLTNLRVVRDSDDPGNHTGVVEELPGWHIIPEW